MRISCMVGPAASTPDDIVLAEELGYSRAYCYDSPALCPDMFMTFALAARRTSRIGLATGVLVPRMRHIMTTASALATLHRLAPGRVVFGVGSGFTASRTLGQPALRWSYVRDYVAGVQALLRGEEIEWEGAIVRFIASPDFADALPCELPLMIAAEGPKGLQVARDLDAELCVATPLAPEGFDRLARPVFGTVLDDGESPHSDRVHSVVGAGVAIAYHTSYEYGGADAVDQLPGGAAWRARVEQIAIERRHLAIHEGHAHFPNEIDEATIPREMASSLSLTGTADEVRQRVIALGDSGVTEVIFVANGPDIPRELRRFAEAVADLITVA